MNKLPERENDLHRLAEAAAWRVALAEAGLGSSLEFEVWLAKDHENANAWAQVQAPWQRVNENPTAPEVLAAREEALQYVRRERERRHARSSWFSLRIAASFAAIAMLGAVGFSTWHASRGDMYQTALGERRSITLADGSNVVLDSNALLKVHFKKEARDLELVRGQAHFSVAHDLTRPFSVHAGDRVVVATGTSFNVDLLGAQVIVTLIEGKVNVLREEVGSWPLPWHDRKQVIVARLNPGQQLVKTNPRKVEVGAKNEVVRERIGSANLDRATAWENGQLVFDNEALASVAERVGRYGPVKLVVKGPAADLRISGVFNSGDISAFVEAVQRTLPVHAECVEGQIVLRSN